MCEQVETREDMTVGCNCVKHVWMEVLGLDVKEWNDDEGMVDREMHGAGTKSEPTRESMGAYLDNSLEHMEGQVWNGVWE